MSKTAEEILRDVYSPSEPYGSAINAMEEFAAQEVEAYKERVFKNMKNLVARSTPSDWEIGWNNAIASSVQTIKQTK